MSRPPPARTPEIVFKALTGCSRPQVFVDWAVQATIDGYESEALYALAGADLDGGPYWAEVRDLFHRAARDLGLVLDDVHTAARLYVADIAKLICRNEIDPIVAVNQIHAEVISPLEHPFDLLGWCSLWEGNHPEEVIPMEEEELPSAIRRYAEEWVSIRR
jgi:hypothetical protein